MNAPQLTRISATGGPNTTILAGPVAQLQELTALLGDAAELDLWQFTGADPQPEEVRRFAEVLEEQVSALTLKRLSLVGVSWGGPICIQYASTFPRNMRRLVLIDAKARLKQSAVERGIEWLENFLPLGLPLRPLSKAFDPRPLLHRVRCPTLVLKTHPEDPDAEFLADRIPNAWKKAISIQEFAPIFHDFLEVQTKQPQKRANG